MNQKFIIQNIQVPQDKSISLCLLKEQHFIVATLSNNNKNFISIPRSVVNYTYDSTSKMLVLSGNIPASVDFARFCLVLSEWLKDAGRIYRKKLTLKGLGYKVGLIKNNTILELKIGFSHPILISIPVKDIIVRINKQTITIEGQNSALVGNFANKIRQLKLPDSYKGKGIWYKNEIRILKELKKK